MWWQIGAAANVVVVAAYVGIAFAVLFPLLRTPLSAVVGVGCWSLRSTYGPLVRGTGLFEDTKEQQPRAREVDDIVQGLALAGPPWSSTSGSRAARNWSGR